MTRAGTCSTFRAFGAIGGNNGQVAAQQVQQLQAERPRADAYQRAHPPPAPAPPPQTQELQQQGSSGGGQAQKDPPHFFDWAWANHANSIIENIATYVALLTQSMVLISFWVSLLSTANGIATVFAKDLPPVLKDLQAKNWAAFDAALLVLAADTLQTIWNGANWWLRIKIATAIGGDIAFDALPRIEEIISPGKQNAQDSMVYADQKRRVRIHRQKEVHQKP